MKIEDEIEFEKQVYKVMYEVLEYTKKQFRENLCYCRSGKKYKKCCMSKNKYNKYR